MTKDLAVEYIQDCDCGKVHNCAKCTHPIPRGARVWVFGDRQLVCASCYPVVMREGAKQATLF